MLPRIAPVLCTSRRSRECIKFLHVSCVAQKQQPDSASGRLLSSVREFVREEVIPQAGHYDKTGEFPWPLVRKAHTLGIMNTDTPKELGGLGLDLRTKVQIFEELAYGCTALASSFMISDLSQIPILKAGSEQLKKKYIATLTREPLLASYATTEHDAGSDVSNAKLSAVEDGDSYILNGTKDWISNAGVAPWIFVLARTSKESSSGSAFTGFIVERDLPGITIGEKEVNMGLRAADIRSVSFADVRVSKENIIKETGQGFSVIMQAFDRVRPVIAALGCGLQKRALDEATKYALQRTTFNKRLVDHEGVSFKLADMAQNLEASKLLAQRAADKMESADPEATYFSSIAKCFSADAAFKAAGEAVQILGANGYNVVYPVEKLLRDSKALQLMGGTVEIQRVIIAREIAKNYSELTEKHN